MTKIGGENPIFANAVRSLCPVMSGRRRSRTSAAGRYCFARPSAISAEWARIGVRPCSAMRVPRRTANSTLSSTTRMALSDIASGQLSSDPRGGLSAASALRLRDLDVLHPQIVEQRLEQLLLLA